MSFQAIEGLTDDQIEDLYWMYQTQWWTQGRQMSDIRRMLKYSDEIVAFGDANTKRLVAFARILTDYVYKALILDVMVEASYQSKGLGHILINSIINHPKLNVVQHFELYCLGEMVQFYQKWGFTEETGELRFMRWAR